MSGKMEDRRGDNPELARTWRVAAGTWVASWDNMMEQDNTETYPTPVVAVALHMLRESQTG